MTSSIDAKTLLAKDYRLQTNMWFEGSTHKRGGRKGRGVERIDESEHSK